MKKITVFLLTLTLLVTSISVLAFADEHYVDVNSSIYSFEDYIPLRQTFEDLGYEVSWQSETRMVEIEKENNTVYVRAGDKYLLRNGVLVDGIDTPMITYGRMYLSAKTIGLIFETHDKVNPTTFRIYDGLKGLDGELPKLKDKTEYDKLISFYPNQDIYYRDFSGGIMEDGMDLEAGAVEESKEADVSETNTQVEGVDEADIVKIDENYIYALRDQKLQIMTTGRDNLSILYNIEEPGFWPQQLFITEDKLILIGNETSTEVHTYEEDDRIMTMPIYRQTVLMVKCYDISSLDKEAPKLIKSFGVEGNYLSARLVDDYVYVVANQYMYYGGPIMPMILEKDETNILSRTEVGFEDLSYFPGHVNENIIYTMGIDLNNLTKEGLDIDTYIGGGNTLYADKDSMYLALQSNSGMWWRDWRQSTDIFSFDLNEGKIDFKAKGNVPGYILNQFSMDEHKGHFRIATTKWGSEDVTLGNTTLNNLYILDESLTEVGALENLAPGETIFSTRMMGDQVYMVTYRQIDPFYVIDTSVPEEPKVLGYLKIPGYSNYLHPYDENTIIGVGMQTKLVNERVVNDGVKISLFDVSDFENPVEKDKVILGTGNSSTDVGYDHKAFLFNKEKNIMAIPMTLENVNYSRYSKDAYVFSFTDDVMLDFRGAITHATLSEEDKTYYDYNDSISRIMYINNDIYTLSNKWLMLSDFETLKEVDSLKR